MQTASRIRGFRHRTAKTARSASGGRTATARQVPEFLSGWQDYGGRLWDTLFLAAAAFKRAGDKTLVQFEVIYQTDPHRSSTVTLWLCFFENEGFTVLLPEEY